MCLVTDSGWVTDQPGAGYRTCGALKGRHCPGNSGRGLPRRYIVSARIASAFCLYIDIVSGTRVRLVKMEFCSLCESMSPPIATAASVDSTAPSYLTELKVYEQPASYALLLILPFFVFPLCARTRLVRDLLSYAALSGTVFLAKKGFETHISQIIFEVSPLQAIL